MESEANKPWACTPSREVQPQWVQAAIAVRVSGR